MTNFCTLFDSNYLTRGLALYQSLKKVCSSFHLYVLAFDDNAYRYLNEAKFQHLTVIALTDFEDDDLLKIKSARSIAEYCWTCTPSIILYCINKYQLPSCTYIDADMIFCHDPVVLIDEMKDNSILISEHRYTKDYDQSAKSGIYCVQFMCFKNTDEGITALSWWRDRCIEWCYARHEDGKFGDQKYLDDWTTRFKGVHVMQHPGGGLAPWNIQQYECMVQDKELIVIDKKTFQRFPLIFFHFHGVKFYTNQFVSCCEALYEIDRSTKDLLYLPYFARLMEIEDNLRKQGIRFNVNGARAKKPSGINVSAQYIKDLMALWKMGNISPALRFFILSKHNHFYSLEFIRKYYGRVN